VQRSICYLYYINDKQINLISLTLFGFHLSLFKSRTPCQILSIITTIYCIIVQVHVHTGMYVGGGIVMGYGLDGPGSIPGSAGYFSSPQCPN
jgi:hypothetical protein